jgi:predicted aspartyl protease
MGSRAPARLVCAVAVLTLALLDCSGRQRLALAPAQTVLASERAELPVTRCGGRFVVQAVIDGAGPFRLVLDTGSSAILLGSRIADAAKLPSAGNGAVVGTVAGSRRLDRTVHVVALRVGQLELHDFKALVYATPDNLGGDARAYDGVLGMSAFSDVTLTLDFPRSRVFASRAPLPLDASTSEVDFSIGVPVVWASWGDFAVPAILDTGFTGEFALPHGGDWSFLTAPGLRARSGRLDGDVSFGSLVLATPSVRLTAQPALIGTEALRDVVLTLDAHNHRVRFEGPRTVASTPEQGIGASFREYEESWEVQSVFEDTPAALAGLHAGDRVVAIYELPVCAFACGKWQERVRSPHAVRLDVRRDGEPLAIVVGTATLLD